MMQIVIDIPDEIRKSISDDVYCGIIDKRVFDAIKNGTPLPKGHGRLIDADEINSRISREYCGYMLSESSAPIEFCIMIDEESTIIEADGGEE